MSCGVDCRHGLNLALLWLWCRLTATALIQLLAWELPYTVGGPKKTKKKKKKGKKKKRKGGREEGREKEKEIALVITQNYGM